MTPSASPQYEVIRSTIDQRHGKPQHKKISLYIITSCSRVRPHSWRRLASHTRTPTDRTNQVSKSALDECAAASQRLLCGALWHATGGSDALYTSPAQGFLGPRLKT